MMAAMAETFADIVMVTDDNPRTENAEQIFAEIMLGFSDEQKVLQEHDRAKAIQQMIAEASPNDCVLIAGKGAEPYQIIGDKKYPFSDVQVAEAALAD